MLSTTHAVRSGPLAACLGLALLSTLATPPASVGDDARNMLRFTAIPDHNATDLKQKYDPVARYLSEQLGVEVDYIPAADYQASVEMFKNGDVQLAWFGGLTGVQARQAVPGARAIVQGREDPQYTSYFIAHVSTGIERSEAFPAEIAKVPFTFGSASSTSGRLMPEFFIRQNTGKSPAEFFEHPFGFSDSHSKTADLVARGGSVKAGVLNYLTYDHMIETGEIDPAVCRVVWQTPPYADYNLSAHPALEQMFGAGFIERVQAVLVSMDDPDLLAAFQRSSLIPATNEQFEEIAEVARTLGMLR